jgi:activator of HSP90 ATPase
MNDSLELSVKLNVTSEKLYNDWLDSKAHSNFTGSPAHIDPSPDGKFTAWEGYIYGTNKLLEPFKKIVQAWRTTEFGEKEEDSTLEIIFESEGDKTRLILKHSNIPEGQGEEYKQGWKDFYFKPMKEFYNRKQ